MSPAARVRLWMHAHGSIGAKLAGRRSSKFCDDVGAHWLIRAADITGTRFVRAALPRTTRPELRNSGGCAIRRTRFVATGAQRVDGALRLLGTSTPGGLMVAGVDVGATGTPTP